MKNELEIALQSISQCRWARIPYPYLKYPCYVSEEGEVCTVHHGKVRKAAIWRDSRKRNQRHRVRLQTTRGRTDFMLIKCIYLSFKVGKWIEDIKIRHIDNDIDNCRLSNLEEKKDEINVAFMQEHTDDYIRFFDEFVLKIAYRYTMRYDDACDVVQDAFIYTSLHSISKGCPFDSAWFCTAKEYAINLYRKQQILCSIITKLMEMEASPENDSCGCGFEYPLYHRIKDERTRQIIQMQLEGYNYREIIQRLNISRSWYSILKNRGYEELRLRVKL